MIEGMTRGIDNVPLTEGQRQAILLLQSLLHLEDVEMYADINTFGTMFMCRIPLQGQHLEDYHKYQIGEPA